MKKKKVTVFTNKRKDRAGVILPFDQLIKKIELAPLPDIGKSLLMRKIAKKAGLKVKTIGVTKTKPTDFKGLPNSKRRRITVANVLKVIDVFTSDVSIGTYNYLMNFYVAYDDRILHEPLLNIVSAEEETEWLPTDKAVRAQVKREVKALSQLATDNDAAYVRFIT